MFFFVLFVFFLYSLSLDEYRTNEEEEQEKKIPFHTKKKMKKIRIQNAYILKWQQFDEIIYESRIVVVHLHRYISI